MTAAEVYLSNLLSKQFRSTGFNCLVLTSCSYEHITVSVPSPLPGTYKCQGNKVAESFICREKPAAQAVLMIVISLSSSFLTSEENEIMHNGSIFSLCRNTQLKSTASTTIIKGPLTRLIMGVTSPLSIHPLHYFTEDVTAWRCVPCGVASPSDVHAFTSGDM